MSPLRFVGSLLASSRRRIGSAALRSHFPMGESRGSLVTMSALSVIMGGMWYFREETAARKPIHRHHQQQEILEEDTIEEKAMKKRFEEWMVKYERRYKDKEEKAMRYEIFKRTAQHTDEHNARPGILCTLGTNNFADKTVEEVISWCCGGPRSRISGEEFLRGVYLD